MSFFFYICLNFIINKPSRRRSHLQDTSEDMCPFNYNYYIVYCGTFVQCYDVALCKYPKRNLWSKRDGTPIQSVYGNTVEKVSTTTHTAQSRTTTTGLVRQMWAIRQESIEKGYGILMGGGWDEGGERVALSKADDEESESGQTRHRPRQIK